MKASSLYFALGAAQVAICAPVTRSLTNHMNEAADTTHGVTTRPQVWSTLDSQGDAPGRARHHSVPPHPIKGDILSLHIPDTRKQDSPDVRVIRVPHPVHDENDILELLGMDVTRSRQPAGVPCQGMSSSERNNMLVVFLAVAFFVVVVIMEACGSVFRRYVLPRSPVLRATRFPRKGTNRRLISIRHPHRQGVIRLEEPTSQPPLSIRATPHGQDDKRDEKRCV
jgi:hypothetical protein